MIYMQTTASGNAMSMKYMAIAVLMVMTVIHSTTWAQDEQIIEPPTIIGVLALDAEEHTMAQAYLALPAEWVVIDSGDPITLEHGVPKSLDWKPDPDRECPVTEAQQYLVNCQYMLRNANAASKCSFPLHPTGVFYQADIGGMATAIIRFSEGVEPAEVIARVGDDDYEMEPIDVESVIRMQMTGVEYEVKPDGLMLEYLVNRQDNESWIACHDQKNQAEELISTAHLLEKLLERYYEKNGQYPGSLCQLYTGDEGIISAVPRNPYQWEKDVCATQYGTGLPQGYIRYYPQREGTVLEKGKPIGYWIAVMDRGDEVKPDMSLPDEYESPFRVIHWIEKHPETVESEQP